MAENKAVGVHEGIALYDVLFKDVCGALQSYADDCRRIGRLFS